MGILDKIFDPGRSARKTAARATQAGVFDGLSADGPGGLFVRQGFDPATGRMGELSTGLGSFQDPFLQLISGASGDLRGNDRLPTAIQQALSQSGNTFSRGAVSSVDNASNFNGLGSLFSSALPIAGGDPFDIGAGVTDRLRAGATRSNENLVNRTFDRLFQSGGLANSVTREQVTGDLGRQLDEQDLQFQLAGLDAGRGIQSDAVNRLFSSVQGREGIAGRNFGERFSSEQLLADNAARRFGINLQAGQFLQNQRQVGQNLALSGLQGAAGLATLPLAFQNAGLAASGLRANTFGQQANTAATNAANSRSPLLETINAVGSFAGNIPGIGQIFGGGAPAASTPVTVGASANSAFRGIDPFRNMFGGI